MTDPDGIQAAFAQAKAWMDQYCIPVIVEIILVRVTNIAAFEDLAKDGADVPTSTVPLD